MPVSYDLFLSHNRQQKPWVRELVSFLREMGLTVFFDEDSIRPGEDFVVAIERALEGSRRVILVLSRAAVRSPWVSFETALRIADDPFGERKPLIPILAEPLHRNELRLSLRRLDAVNLTDPSTREAEFVHFLRALGVPEERCHAITTWPPPVGVETLYVADINSVVAAGWSGVDLLERLIALDYEVFEGLSSRHEGEPEQWAPVFMEHPETWRLLTTSAKEIVGYWHFVPLFDDDFERALNGELVDSEITSDRLRLFELPGWYDVYFVSVGIQARYRRPRAVSLLFTSIVDVLDELAANGVFLRRLCANAYTPSGAALCRSLGLQEMGLHSERGRMFAGRIDELLLGAPLAQHSQVAKHYQEALRAVRT